jgi:potassium large conductance calcium-activated channel subfamily M alpha protein 1
MKEQMIGKICRGSSFFNPNTVSIVEQMVEGGYVEHDGCLGDDHSRLLEQIEVPIQYVNHHFCDLFTGLLREKGILSLGIYRACGTLGSPTAYVLTNPLKETIINAGDLVYVLC